MVANVSFNPGITTNAAGSFNTSSNGLIQGTAYDDPAVRYALAGGILASTETLPMWGGVGIYNLIPGVAGAQDASLGEVIGRANSLTGANALTGFSVFNQAYGMLNTPQSPVPLAGSYMQVNFYRLGSGARIHVACDPALVALDGTIITSQVSWDFNAQMLVPYEPTQAQLAISVISWAAGVVSVTTGAANTLVTGDDVTISGCVPAGYNGDFPITVTDTTHFTYPLAVNPGAETTLGVVNAGGGALNVRVLETQIGNSMTVSFNAATGFATWNRQGSAATILI